MTEAQERAAFCIVECIIIGGYIITLLSIMVATYRRRHIVFARDEMLQQFRRTIKNLTKENRQLRQKLYGAEYR